MNDRSFVGDIDFSVTPYSRAGSWISISRLGEAHGIRPEGLYIRTNREVFSYAPLFRVELLKGTEPVPFTERLMPGALRLESAPGEWAEFSFERSGAVRFRSESLGCRLTTGHPGSGIGIAFQAFPTLWRFTWRGACRENCFFHLQRLSGRCEFDTRWDGMASRGSVWSVEPAGGAAEFVLADSALEPQEREFDSFEACVEDSEREFAAFRAAFPQLEAFTRERFLALYLNWSTQVAPTGLYKRRCMLVSKNKMNGMWSWDHCFNSLAMAAAQPQLAFDQFMAMFDYQDEQGAIPDLLTPNLMIRVHVKPPVHGWIFSLMRRANREFFRRREITLQIYDVLSRWSHFWTEFRDYPGLGLPFYSHGKDTGWDNATIFLNPLPLASPELAAYLVLQMELLGELAAELGRKSESRYWNESAAQLLDRMLKLMWDGKTFHAVSASGEMLPQQGDCLIVYMPLLLGKRLPETVRAALREGMLRPGGRFRTEFGLASESVSSPRYEPAGYWRGPIWAPSTFIAATGLAGCGDENGARLLAADYCRLCSMHGFHENFNALTGAGNDDKTLSWSASVFLILSEALQTGKLPAL